ncbi:hypothetical protein FACS189499_00160 [Clostridia bacterium]|nr:hypothetical protein FACS189499_00160 [Clostridia bacterium]
MQPDNYVTTYKKHRFPPLTPRPENIDIEDIAHSLSRICRANGHLPIFFSVALHSLNCEREAAARRLDTETRLILLLHDASEAYLSDIVRPVKIALPDYHIAEKVLQDTILTSFGISPESDKRIYEKPIDDAMLYAEFKNLSGELVYETEPEIHSTPDLRERGFCEVEEEFLERFLHLHKNLTLEPV